jgi:hypothetical protein
VYVTVWPLTVTSPVLGGATAIVTSSPSTSTATSAIATGVSSGVVTDASSIVGG